MVTTKKGIAARIQEEIEHHNSQAKDPKEKRGILWLAESSGVSRTTLKRRMADEDGFTMRELVKVSTALGLDPHELVAHYFAETKVSA